MLDKFHSIMRKTNSRASGISIFVLDSATGDSYQNFQINVGLLPFSTPFEEDAISGGNPSQSKYWKWVDCESKLYNSTENSGKVKAFTDDE